MTAPVASRRNHRSRPGSERSERPGTSLQEVLQRRRFDRAVQTPARRIGAAGWVMLLQQHRLRRLPAIPHAFRVANLPHAPVVDRDPACRALPATGPITVGDPLRSRAPLPLRVPAAQAGESCTRSDRGETAGEAASFPRLSEEACGTLRAPNPTLGTVHRSASASGDDPGAVRFLPVGPRGPGS